MEPAFDVRTRNVIIETAKQLNIPVHTSGTVVTIEGPRFSSRAESNLFRQWGGHVINMTTIPEVVLAKELGICYVAIALATDYDCWRENCSEHVNVSDVLATFKKNVVKVTRLITAAVPNIAKEDWTDYSKQLRVSLKILIFL